MSSSGGFGQSRTSWLAMATAMKSCQTWAGNEPPDTRRPATLYIDSWLLGLPIHTATASCGV